jgi:hypothetical protein
MQFVWVKQLNLPTFYG